MPLIHVDTGALTYPWFWLPGVVPHFVDGSVPGGAAVSLPAGRYTVQQTRDHPCDLGFVVTPDGLVEYAASDDHLLRGRGTTTLHVLGLPVTLTSGGGAPPLLPMWGGCVEPIRDAVRTVRMPPGRDYALRLGRLSREHLRFSVRRDGVVDYAAEFETALSGRGTACLTVDPPVARR